MTTSKPRWNTVLVLVWVLGLSLVPLMVGLMWMLVFKDGFGVVAVD